MDCKREVSVTKGTFMEEREGVNTPSYKNVLANEMSGTRSKWPPLESPPHIEEDIVQYEQQFGKSMYVEAETSHPKVNSI
jgi:hypothetical protein